MKWLIPLIFTYVSCTDVLTSVPTIPTTYATTCGPSNPTTSTDCTKINTIFQYCCYFTPLAGGAGFCNPVSPPTFQQDMKTFPINGTTYNITCDVAPGTQASPCGIVNPQKNTDCTSKSTSTNSCCYYTNSTLNVSYCLWMGMSVTVSPTPVLDCTPPSSTPIPTAGGYIQFNLWIFSLLFFISILL